MNAPHAKAIFHWEDPLLLEEQLTSDERQIRDAAQSYCQGRLMPRVLEANRHEKFDRQIVNEMGELGFLGVAFPEQYGGGGADTLAQVLVVEGISRYDAGIGLTCAAQMSPASTSHEPSALTAPLGANVNRVSVSVPRSTRTAQAEAA